jgi:glycosyltransferase involved in cell wall biosynthesis
LRGKRLVIFLGRLHPKKGVPMLLEAWANTTKPEDAHLLIAGPDSDGMQFGLEQLVADLHIGSSVTFLGMLTGNRKWSALAAAHLFVLPSVSEGFSIAVLEALAMGLPVLISQPCHFPEVSQKQCGWVISPKQGPLEEALHHFFRLPVSDCIPMGQRARELVNQRFRWSVVGRQMGEVYNWVDGGPKPQEVTIV